MFVRFHDGAIHATGQAEIVSIDDQAAHRASLAGTSGNDVPLAMEAGRPTRPPQSANYFFAAALTFAHRAF